MCMRYRNILCAADFEEMAARCIRRWFRFINSHPWLVRRPLRPAHLASASFAAFHHARSAFRASRPPAPSHGQQHQCFTSLLALPPHRTLTHSSRFLIKEERVVAASQGHSKEGRFGSARQLSPRGARPASRCQGARAICATARGCFCLDERV